MQERLVLRRPYAHTMNFSTLILSMDKNSYKIIFYSLSIEIKSNLFIFLFHYSYIKHFVNLVVSITLIIKKDNFKDIILFYFIIIFYYINSFFSSFFSYTYRL